MGDWIIESDIIRLQRKARDATCAEERLRLIAIIDSKIRQLPYVHAATSSQVPQQPRSKGGWW